MDNLGVQYPREGDDLAPLQWFQNVSFMVSLTPTLSVITTCPLSSFLRISIMVNLRAV